MKLKLVQTCGACPEQYDAFTPEGEKIGYLRLRHGYFRVDFVPTDETVYSASPAGDGCFDWEERDYYLGEACNALIKRYLSQDREIKDTYYF